MWPRQQPKKGSRRARQYSCLIPQHVKNKQASPTVEWQPRRLCSCPSGKNKWALIISRFAVVQPHVTSPRKMEPLALGGIIGHIYIRYLISKGWVSMWEEHPRRVSQPAWSESETPGSQWRGRPCTRVGSSSPLIGSLDVGHSGQVTSWVMGGFFSRSFFLLWGG